MNRDLLRENCGCQVLMTPPVNDKPCFANEGVTPKSSKSLKDTGSSSTNTDAGPRPTGGDCNPAFVLIEVKLNRPFKKPVIPRHIPRYEIDAMLAEMEAVPCKRECTGRGQLERDWLSTVRTATNALRKVPYYGTTDFCTINRQLGGTRTRVEMHTSFWQEAAVYVNNQFVVSNFLDSNEKFEEMTLMAHALLMRLVSDFFSTADTVQSTDGLLKAARHARQLKDIPHATQLLLQMVSKNMDDANLWRELSTCLRDLDSNWAEVCLNKSLSINPRHPLSILAKGCSVFESNPDEAEPFFVCLLRLYPFYKSLWVVASAYYWRQEHFNMANDIITYVRDLDRQAVAEDMKQPRVWEHELGDWWDPTPLLPGTSPFYDACDLLLRIRAISLAEICLARALSDVGETPIYYHLLALCCRLKGNVDDALCHLNVAIKKFGDISYLKTLQGECYHKLKDVVNSTACFEKSGNSLGAYSNLLSLPRREPQRVRAILTDLIRRQPNAYAWMYLADDWLSRSSFGEGGDAGKTEEQKSSTACAIACAAEALKLDRQAGRAWALLSNVVKPSARRLHCENMAKLCGYKKRSEETTNFETESKQSSCFHLGTALRECRCEQCKHLAF
ncbi:uncharacterized protein LOC126965379 [Leptidea sinapis]|uniref:uncharacterized protein LOC126965379 n=1 Tax=Leptidea sinapis TaxID=189913 RepID=UPI0021C449FD|nr:uncharacterized protein LOC126965379 [Leptidea sinapis]